MGLGYKTCRMGGDPIRQLMIDNQVSAFFHGHDHQYGYELRDGIVYQAMPSAGFSGAGFNIYCGTGNGYCIQSWNSPGPPADYGHTHAGDCGLHRETPRGAVNTSYTIEPAPVLTTAVSPSGGGTINPTAGAHTYGKNTAVSITATAVAGTCSTPGAAPAPAPASAPSPWMPISR